MIQKVVRNVYIHLPFCTKKCLFCAFPVHAVGKNPDRSLLDRYIEKLSTQIAYSLDIVNYSQKLQTLYFGGGTPSLYQPKYISKIIKCFKDKINEETEITMQFNLNQFDNMDEYSKIVNRASLGIQTFNRHTLKMFNRQEPDFSVQIITRKILQRKIRNLNVDFIIQLIKGQAQLSDVKSFIKNAKPQHLTIYGLEVNQGSYLYKNKDETRFRQFLQGTEKWTKIDEFVKRYVQMSKFLQQNGYQHYEVSAFAKIKDKDCTLSGKDLSFRSNHNAAYWRGNRNFIGFGMGASSFINSTRMTNPKTISKYFKYVQSLNETNILRGALENKFVQIKREDHKQLLQNVIMSRLRTKQGLSVSEMIDIIYADLKNLQKYQRVAKLADVVIEFIGDSINREIQIIDRNQLVQNKNIRVNIPHGFLYVDLVAYQLSQLILKHLQIK